MKLLTGFAALVLTGVMSAIWLLSMASHPMQVDAAATSVSVTQTCSSDATDSVSFTWQGNDPSAIQQWLDVSTSDNGWQQGTFVSAGPFSGITTSFNWTGIQP